MPIHNWSRVRSGLFHHFHQMWSVNLANALNRGLLPAGYYALVEQRTGTPEPDVIALSASELDGEKLINGSRSGNGSGSGGAALLTRPQTKLQTQTRQDLLRYAEKANRVSVQHPLGRTVAVIEIVSPGNKHSRLAVQEFTQKVIDFLRAGVHVVVLDLFPPGRHDPWGLHGELCELFLGEQYRPAAESPLTLASYEVDPPDMTSYIQPTNFDEPLFAMPLFLRAQGYLPLPLEETYAATWEACPEPIRAFVLQSGSISPGDSAATSTH